MNKFVRPLIRPFKPILKKVAPSLFKYDTLEYWTKKEGPIYFDYWRKNYEGTEKYKLQANIIINTLKEIEFNSLLDYGCGYGRITKLIEKNFHGKKLFGCDVSKHQIQNSRKYLGPDSGCTMIVTDGKSIPFKDNEFDVVMCCDVLLHQTHDLIDIVRNELIRVSNKYVMLYEGNYSENEVTEDSKTDGSPGKSCHKHNHIGFFNDNGFNIIKKEFVKELGNYIMLFEKQ